MSYCYLLRFVKQQQVTVFTFPLTCKLLKQHGRGHVLAVYCGKLFKTGFAVVSSSSFNFLFGKCHYVGVCSIKILQFSNLSPSRSYLTVSGRGSGFPPL